MMELDGTDSLMLCFVIHLVLVPHVFSAPSLYLSTALHTGRRVPWLDSTHGCHFTDTLAVATVLRRMPFHACSEKILSPHTFGVTKGVFLIQSSEMYFLAIWWTHNPSRLRRSMGAQVPRSRRESEAATTVSRRSLSRPGELALQGYNITSPNPQCTLRKQKCLFE